MTTSVEVKARGEQLLLVEDHHATRGLLRDAFLKADPTRQVHEARTGARALELASCGEVDVDVALVDLQLPDHPGVEVIGKLAARGIPCIALTVCYDPASVLAVVEAGAVGYLLKDESAARREEAIKGALSGASVLSAGPARHLMDHLSQRGRARPTAHLSPRERDLVFAFVDGLSYAQVADRLNIGIGTVQDYVKRLYRKLGVQSKAELVAWAMRSGVAR